MCVGCQIKLSLDDEEVVTSIPFEEAFSDSLTFDFSEDLYNYYRTKYVNEKGGTCGKGRKLNIGLSIENHAQS